MRPLAPLLLVFATLPAFSQCSDAGVCALERLNRTDGHSLSLTFIHGSSGSRTGGQVDDLTFQTARLDGQFALSGRTRVALSLPFNRVSGPLGSSRGPGDATLLVDHQVWQGNSRSLAIQAGLRVALGKADAEATLPQAYQPSLGTTDVLAGVRYGSPTWQGGIGYQRAGGRNDNPLTRLQRADELLVWGERGWDFSLGRGALKALYLQPLGKASIRLADGFAEVSRSDQPQLNLVPSLEIPTGTAGFIHLSVALPLLPRDTNVDGLKRAMTVSLGFRMMF
jgi:hypothetical protein